MKQEVIQLFDEYTHKPLTREDFLSKLIKMVGGTTAAMALLPLLEGKYAVAQQVAEDDKSLKIANISFQGKNAVMKGYLVMPKKIKGKVGCVLVIHENRGLTPHIKDVTRRVAKAGYIALGIDALSPLGGTPTNEDEARTLFGKLDAKQNIENLISAFAYLNTLKKSNNKNACVGFCWGGGLVNDIAVNFPDLNGGVSYYGRQAAVADVPKIKAKMLFQYGGLDERINAGIPVFEAALKANAISYNLYVYEGAQHAFNNDSSPARYNAETAKLAWSRTLALFKEVLS
jgi:carboxymethylenebutenolidase